jgi:hypothetical protein
MALDSLQHPLIVFKNDLRAFHTIVGVLRAMGLLVFVKENTNTVERISRCW